MSNQLDWSEWYDMNRNEAPNALLVETISYIKYIGKVLDIGAGALKDARYLLDKGFDVTVLDQNPALIGEVSKINSDRLHSHVIAVEDFDFPEAEYDLISAMHSLSYSKAERFGHVIEGIKRSLKQNGIFCGHMYDSYDQWSKDIQKDGFHNSYKNINEIRDYFDDLDIIVLREQETEQGRTKHWRIYDIIVRK